MSVSSAIGMVSKSLRTLLLEELSEEILSLEVQVTVLAPDEISSDSCINLFLYKVIENPELKNLDWQVRANNTGRLAPPPLSLNLYYLLTAYMPNDPELGNSTAHEILGDAMRVFYENAIIPRNYLEEGLQGAREQIRIMQTHFDMEELSQVWNTSGKPFRLSVMYEVSVVQLDMLAEKERQMPARVREIGVPRMMTPYQPPFLDEIAPGSGPAGTVITFGGKHLAGWKAYVTLLGRPIDVAENSLNEDGKLAGNSFDVTIPAGLNPGFYNIRVDVSRLFRRTFSFEVTE